MVKKARVPTIFGFGSATVDFRVRTAELGSEYRAKLLAQETATLGGGAVANALVQVSRLGGRASYLGKLGADWIGERIVEGLEAEGVDCSTVIRDPSSSSPFNLAAYAGEDRRRIGGFLLPNSLASMTRGEIDILAARPRPGDMLLVELGEIPISACLQFASVCEANGVQIALDVDLDPIAQCRATSDEFEALARLSRLIMPNREAMTALYPGLSPDTLTQEMSRLFAATVIVTAGKDGAFFSTPDKTVVHRPALETDVVDTVGAGDAFHGAVVFALSTGRTLEAAVELGVRCGAINCQSSGAREGMPTASELGLNIDKVDHHGL